MQSLFARCDGRIVALCIVLLPASGRLDAQEEPASRAGERQSPPAGANVAAQRARIVRTEIQRVTAEIEAVDRKLPPLLKEIEELHKRLAEAPAESKVAEEEPEREARKIEFRPPLSRVSKRETNLAIVCEEGRARFLDLEEFGVLFKELAGKGTAANVEQLMKLKSGDYDVRCKIVVLELGTFTIRRPEAVIVRKQDRSGETPEEFRDAGSTLRKRLKALDPSKNIVQFMVFPDSHDTFRDVRSVLWEMGFEVGWIPKNTGEVLELGGGNARSQ